MVVVVEAGDMLTELDSVVVVRLTAWSSSSCSCSTVVQAGSINAAARANEKVSSVFIRFGWFGLWVYTVKFALSRGAARITGAASVGTS